MSACRAQTAFLRIKLRFIRVYIHVNALLHRQFCRAWPRQYFAVCSRKKRRFLRIACTAVPFTSVNALVMYFFQAMGKGTQATILAVCRQGALNIPMLFLMNWLVGLYGMIRVQLIIEVVMLPFMLGMYFYTICNYLKSHANGLAHFL